MRTVTTADFVRYIKGGRIQPVLPMIAEKARATWKKLPGSQQLVLSIADLIQEGVNFTITSVCDSFNPKMGAKFSTFLYTALDNFYADIIRKVYADKRFIARHVLSADTDTISIGDRCVSIIDVAKVTMKSRYDVERRMINRIDAERGFIKAYAPASPRLRRYLIKWLLQPRVSRNKPGTDFDLAKREFKVVAKPFLTSEMCETIQNDYVCRFMIADKLAKSFRTEKKAKPGITGYLASEESELSPILSIARATTVMPLVGQIPAMIG